MTAFVNVPDKNIELNFCSQNPFFILFTPKIVSFDLTKESHDSRGAHNLIESICGCDSNSASVSFNGENVYEAGNVKDFHDGLIDVCNSHVALLIHHLLRTKQHAQASGRDVIQPGKVKCQIFDVGEGALHLRLQLGSGGRIQATLQSDDKVGSV